MLLTMIKTTEIKTKTINGNHGKSYEKQGENSDTFEE